MVDNPIRFGAMGPLSQPYFMDLVCIGEFMPAYILNLQAMDITLTPLDTAKIEF